MIHEFQVRVQPRDAANEQSLKQYIAREKGMDVRTITAVRILRRSIDARQRTIFVNLMVRVFVNEMPKGDEFVRREYGDVSSCKPVIVVGAGPAGIFTALEMLRYGSKKKITIIDNYIDDSILKMLSKKNAKRTV